MIEKILSNLATEYGFSLTGIIQIDGRSVGVMGVRLLKLQSQRQETSVLVYEKDLEKLDQGELTEAMSIRLHQGLMRLKQQLCKLHSER